MPWAHTLRRWLWRANAALALGVLAVWIVAVIDEPGDRPPLRMPEPQPAVTTEPLGPDIAHEEMVALARAFHGWGEAVARAERVAEAPADDRLPLRAFEVRMWYRDPAGPDAILLLTKDPAHSERFLPREGQPDQGVSIERIERGGRRAFITVARGEERCTFPVLDASVPSRGDGRIVRVTPSRSAQEGRERLAQETRLPGRVVVKVLPYFGRNGQVEGVRITGVRPGSAFARAGLSAGDVIVGVDDAPFASVDACRAVLEEGASVRSLRVRARDDEDIRRVDINS